MPAPRNPYRQDGWADGGLLTSGALVSADGLTGPLLDELLHRAYAEGVTKGHEAARAAIPEIRAEAFDEGYDIGREDALNWVRANVGRSIKGCHRRLGEILGGPRSTIERDRKRVAAEAAQIDFELKRLDEGPA